MSNRNNSDTSQILDEGSLSPCDFSLVMYFMVSCLLFAVGFKITFFSNEENDNDTNSNRYWLGPLFLFSGMFIVQFFLMNRNRLIINY